MLKLAICDDMPQEREALRRFLESYFAQAGYEYEITEYMCGEPLAADYEDGDGDFDLIFLDIFMGELNGLETAKKIRGHNETVPIVFLTTSPDFALEGYEVRAMGYLLKPLVQEKAVALLDHFLREEYAESQKSLLIREGTHVMRLTHREIVYIASSNAVLLLHTEKGETHRLYRKLGELEAELGGFGFLRCHQSFLVNLEHVSETVQSEFMMSDGARVPIRRQDAKKMRDAYFEYLLQKAKFF